MNEQRLEKWFNGKLDDNDLTMEEINWLQEAVFDAVSIKILEKDGICTFPNAKGIH